MGKQKRKTFYSDAILVAGHKVVAQVLRIPSSLVVVSRVVVDVVVDRLVGLGGDLVAPGQRRRGVVGLRVVDRVAGLRFFAVVRLVDSVVPLVEVLLVIALFVVGSAVIEEVVVGALVVVVLVAAIG